MPDIEHMPVADDPRMWSSFRKNLTLFLVASASMTAGFAVNIQNPAVGEMEQDLNATSGQFSLSISVFILVQGLLPLLWSAVSEIKGRKLVYISSLGLSVVGSIVVATSRTMPLVIGFRALQAAGLSAVMAIGAASLADIFDPVERGTKMGIYYIAPQLGPAIGPIFGGVLTTAFNWRAIFWFLAIVGGTNALNFLFFFKDTFRRERSLTYQNILRERLSEKPRDQNNSSSTSQQEHTINLADIKISLKDLNPIEPQLQILRRWNNIAILVASGLQFAFGFILTYTSSRTLSSAYNYNALKIGLVILTYGIGDIIGGRWSDRELRQRKAANGGISFAEMRLKSTLLGVIMLPPCILAFGWVCQERVNVSAICILLFACGFFSIWQYTSTLAYIVDANVGRSSSAVSINSTFRGIAAFIGTELAVPMQDGLGDGWTYTIWTVIMALSGALILIVAVKGRGWREAAEAQEKHRQQAKE
ncbi:vacuolar DHA amino acid exporter, partial [Pluteus cervinus]